MVINTKTVSEISGKHEKFCQNYVLYRNATEAAKAAGYSATSAHNQGSRLLKRPEIQRRIDNLEKEMKTTIDVVGELEKQYKYATNNNHTNSALKALELLTRLQTQDEKEVPATVEELEGNIIKNLEMLGETRSLDILSKCKWHDNKEKEVLETEKKRLELELRQKEEKLEEQKEKTDQQ